jgi:hypothetical protein
MDAKQPITFAESQIAQPIFTLESIELALETSTMDQRTICTPNTQWAPLSIHQSMDTSKARQGQAIALGFHLRASIPIITIVNSQIFACYVTIDA